MLYDIDYNPLDYAAGLDTSQQQARRQAWEQARAVRLPPKKSERWKYTDLSRYIGEDCQLLKAGAISQDACDEIAALKHAGCYTLVLVDGQLDQQLSDAEALEQVGVSVNPVTVLALETPDYAPDEVMLALNQAAHTSGVSLQIGADVSLKLPVELLYVSTGQADGNYMVNYKNVITLGAHARATMQERFIHLGHESIPPVYNMQVQVNLHQHAQLNLDVPLGSRQAETAIIHSLHSHHDEGAVLNYVNLSLEGRLSRFEVIAHLNAPYASACLRGVSLVDGSRHVDHHLRAAHHASHTSSDVLYRMLATGKGSATFNAKALASRAVKKIQALQNNKNILLSNQAEINTKPELEIYADDVVCSHGATVGQLDEQAIYYIRTRGIPRHKAEQLLSESFVLEVLDKEDGHREAYQDEIIAKLDRMLG